MLRYLEPWHADVYDFIELRKNHGKEEQRARDLFLGLWIPDLFMKRVKQNEEGPAAVGFLAATRHVFRMAGLSEVRFYIVDEVRKTVSAEVNLETCQLFLLLTLLFHSVVGVHWYVLSLIGKHKSFIGVETISGLFKVI